MRRLLKWCGIGLGSVLVAVIVSIILFQKFSDGPYGPLQGGPFKTGEVVAAPVDDWSVLQGDFEFESVSTGKSRTAGGILLEDAVYISCDLGFMWGRLTGTTRTILHIIWLFKDWHHDAVIDGRMVIRKDGRRYPVTVTRVEDPALQKALENKIEQEARAFFSNAEIGAAPEEEPNDIWFFKVEA